MSKFYKDGGFYETYQVNSVEIGDEYWQELLEGQSQGKKIVSDKHGFPILEDYTVTLEEAKASKLQEINAIYEAKAKAVKIDVPESEVSTWYIQEDEAVAWQADNTVLTPFIDGLATARKVDRLELINRIIAKVTAYKAYMGSLTGQRQYYEDLIAKATTKADLDLINWN